MKQIYIKPNVQIIKAVQEKAILSGSIRRNPNQVYGTIGLSGSSNSLLDMGSYSIGWGDENDETVTKGDAKRFSMWDRWGGEKGVW